MSSTPGPWSNQPANPAAGPPAGWSQHGPAVGGPPSDPYGYGYAPGPPGGPGPAYAPGAPEYAPTAPPYGPPPAPAPGYPAPGPPPALRTDYAGWGKRVGAMLIDMIPTYIGLVILYVGYFLWLIRFSATASSATPDFTAGVVPMIVGAVIMLAGYGWTIYNRYLVAGRTGQSLGKRVTKIKLVSEVTDQPIGPLNAFIRDLVHILDGFAYVGYLWPLWDDKRQTFADKIVRTVVVTAS